MCPITTTGDGVPAPACRQVMPERSVWERRSHGLAVPRDVSVVGYDDSPLIAFTDPPLTTLA